MKLQQILESRGRSVTVKGVSPEHFAQYVRSKSELIDVLKDKYGKGSIDHIVRLFAEHNILVADNVEINAPVNELYKYREYDRDMVNGWTGKATQEEYDDLKQQIAAEGIKQAATLDMTRNHDNGNVEVKLGEGNHRLKIARELGIDTMPLRFYYRK